MSNKYYSKYGMNEFITRLHSIIEVEKEDGLKTHLRQSLMFKDEEKVSGKIFSNGFKIWTHEQGRIGITGIFYPIIEGRVRPWRQELEIEFKSRMNPLSQVIYSLLVVFFSFYVVTRIVIQENNELRFLIPRIIIALILFGLMMSVPSFIYFRTSKISKQYLAKELELKKLELK